MPSLIKDVVRKLVPYRYRNRLRRLAVICNIWNPDAEFDGLGNKDIFEKIYREGHWGSNADGDRKFFSGNGSHEELVVNGYVENVTNFLMEIGSTITIVDLGCGDFNVGSKLAPRCSSYIACDIVSDVIESNKHECLLDNVEFRVVDLVNDDLPCGDVMTVRQVLQHLSNNDILKFVNRVQRYCKYLILTEHIPIDDQFIPNMDKKSGPSIRLHYGSGVDVAEKPFNLVYKTKRTLCEYQGMGGNIRTTVYEF